MGAFSGFDPRVPCWQKLNVLPRWGRLSRLVKQHVGRVGLG